MLTLNRVIGAALLLAVATWVTSTQIQGQPGKTPAVTANAQAKLPAVPVAEPVPADSPFHGKTLVTYQPIKGETVFALQLKPQLDPTPRRPRDILILVSTSAAQAGEGWLVSKQIVEGVIGKTKLDGIEDDRVSLWSVGTPDTTKNLTGDTFYNPSIAEQKQKLDKAYASLIKNYPAGITDLKHAFKEAIKSFEPSALRQRILLYLGEGQSLSNPIDSNERAAIAKEMVANKIAFFPVPLGIRLHSDNLHGLANATGGSVLRTFGVKEKLMDALKRYEDAFAGSILYDAQIKLPAEVTQFYPQELPPLRADAPTLLVGRMQPVKDFACTVTGTIAGRKAPGAWTIQEKAPAGSVDHFFLVNLVDQWKSTKDRLAILRADRALLNAYLQTKVDHQDLVETGHLAISNEKYEDAVRAFQAAKVLAPHDPEAAAGFTIASALRDNKITKESIRQQLGKNNLDKLDGKKLWSKVNGAVVLAQLDAEAKKDAALAAAKLPGAAGGEDAERENLIKALRDRTLVEEQKMNQFVEEALRRARRDLPLDPDTVLDNLKATLHRVKDHPELSDNLRNALAARLETTLKDFTFQARALKLNKNETTLITAQLNRERERQEQIANFQDQVEARFRVYKEMMRVARFEEAKKQELLNQLYNLGLEAREKNLPVPLAARIMYEQTLANYNLQKWADLKRLREERFLSVMLEVEKSFVPFPDEPGIYFPPLATWKALTKLRKEKYEVSSLPDDEDGRRSANAIYKLLQEPVKMTAFQADLTLKDALELFMDAFRNKGKDLAILVDTAAFKAEAPPEAPDIMESRIKFPKYPEVMTMATALNLALSQLPESNGTYLIRREFIEVTTVANMVRDKVLRVYPVGDLVIPISQNVLGPFGQQGGQFGQQSPFGQFGGQFGQFGGQFGQFGGQFGQFGGQFGQFGGQFGQFGGQFGQFGGQFGNPFMQQNPFQQNPLASIANASFQGGFNGSLGALGATQSQALIDIITKVVAPGEWFVTQQQTLFQNPFNPFNPMGPLGNNPANPFGPAAPPATPGVPTMEDIQKVNTIEFFAPALALIVRAPSRVHTSLTGGILGGKPKTPMIAGINNPKNNPVAVAKIEDKGKPDGNVIQKNPPAVAAIKIDLTKKLELDPAKVWEEAFSRGDITPGLVVAAADFLFEGGQALHAAEFLKANLRHGVVVRPWVYQALAVALEQAGGDPEEVRRAKLSAAALDPDDAQGFLQAANTMAENKQYDRALAFCRQAALLEPNRVQAYTNALVFAEHGKDSQAMQWAVGHILSQDWPVDNDALQKQARNRLSSLALALRSESKTAEADKLRLALETLNRRDLVVHLSWENATGELAELDLLVKEPSGGVCSSQSKQTSGGGTFLGADLKQMQKVSYVASHAFSGNYEISVRRLWGKPLGNKATLVIIQNQGTPQESKRLEVIRLDQKDGGSIRVGLTTGRREEMALVSPTNLDKPKSVKQEQEESRSNVASDLRSMAFGDYTMATVTRAGASTPGASHAGPSKASAPGDSRLVFQAPLTPSANAAGVNVTTSMQVSPDNRDVRMVFQPFFSGAKNAESRRLGALPR